MMQMDSERLQELALTVALGAADDDELQEFQNLQKKHPAEAARELAHAHSVAANLALTLPEQAPPESVKRRLLRNVESIEAAVARSTASIRSLESKRASRPFSPRYSRVLAWAAVFLIVILGYGNYAIRERAGHLVEEVRNLQAQLDERQATISLLQTQLATQQRILQVVNAPRLQFVDLQSTKTDKRGSGRVLMDHGARRAVFFAENLPGLEADKDYELWYIAGSTPVPAGVFQVDANGAAAFEISGLPEKLSGIHTFAVTVEQKGGVPVPTLSQMVLAGKVSA
jgi:anti-sigma-K factor RskA